MNPIVSADALTKPYNSASAELRATTACVLHHILTDENLQLCILLWYCGVFFCNLPNLGLSTFQVGTAFLETCTTIELWVCFSNTSPFSPASPNLLLLALPCDASILLHSTRSLLCQSEEHWQLLPVLYTEWFRQGSKSVRSVVVPACPTFLTFSSRLFCLALPLCSLWTWRFSKMSNCMLLFRG